MNKRRLAPWLVVFMLVPGIARADGFIDWLEQWSGPKFIGVGANFHLCFDEDRGFVPCEDLFGLRATSQGFDFDKIRHDIELRVAVYHNIGDQFENDPTPGAVDTRTVWAWKLMPFYYYQIHRTIQVGSGLGILPIYGEGFDKMSRSIITPVSVVIGAPRSVPHALLPFYVRLERSYITQGFTARDFGNTQARYATNGGEWNWSFAVGWDARRLH